MTDRLELRGGLDDSNAVYDNTVDTIDGLRSSCARLAKLIWPTAKQRLKDRNGQCSWYPRLLHVELVPDINNVTSVQTLPPCLITLRKKRCLERHQIYGPVIKKDGEYAKCSTWRRREESA